MTIARVIASRPTAAVVTATADMSVHEAIGILAVHRIGAVPVMDGDTVVGIFSERDVLYCLAKEGAAALDRPVGEVMTAPAITVAPETSVLAALSLITRRRIRHLPVTNGDDFVGFISIGDLVKFRLDAVEREAQAMLSYIQTA